MRLVELPVPLALAAGIAGAAMGAVLGGWRGAAWVGLAALVGFGAGEALVAVLANLGPAATQQPGGMQAAWFAFGQGVMGAVGGAALGWGFAKASEVQ